MNMKYTTNTPTKVLRKIIWNLGYNPIHMTRQEMLIFLMGKV